MVNKVKSSVNTLKRALSKNLRKAGSKAVDNYELLQDKGTEAVESVKEKLHDVYNDNNYYNDYVEKIELFTQRNPFLAIGLAFVLGMFISKFKD